MADNVLFYLALSHSIPRGRWPRYADLGKADIRTADLLIKQP